MSSMDPVNPESADLKREPHSSGNALTNFLLYTASLPERTVRSTIGLAAGAAREAAGALVPRSFQTSKTYELVVQNSLKFLTEQVGGVKASATADETGDEDYMARKAVGNFVDMAGMATLHVSPVWFMAVVSDVAYGSRTYLSELSTELKKQGLIDETSTIDRIDDLLDAVRDASGRAAGLFDTPPLSVDQLKESLEETRKAIQSVDIRQVLPEGELTRYWGEMREISSNENVSLLGVSGALTMHTLHKLNNAGRGAITGVQVVGGLLNKHVVGYYVDSLREVREKGFYESIRETSAPYIDAVWSNFSGQKQTLTEEVVTGRAFGKFWHSVSGWFGGKEKPSPPVEETPANTCQTLDDSARQGTVPS